MSNNKQANTTAQQAQSFTYLGLTFTPYKKLTGKASSFEAISKKISDMKITPDGWKWTQFYIAAWDSSPNIYDYDLFMVNNLVVIPAQNCLFSYRE